MLLKSSDRIESDLSLAAELQINSCALMLRSFIDIDPDFEFHCYVKDSHIILIAQKNLEVYNEALIINQQLYKDMIQCFFSRYLVKFSQTDCEHQCILYHFYLLYSHF